MKSVHLILISLLFWQVASKETGDKCAELERAFLLASDTGELACRCMPNDFKHDDDNEEFVFIGCNKQPMPSVFRALHAVNETNVTQITIWDSVIDPVLSDMFTMVRPKVLSIENSAVSFFRKDPFASLSDRLKTLFLRNNIMQKIDKQVFTNLTQLELLDLSGNKLKAIQKEAFSQLTSLQILMFANNRITSIEDGSFENMANLRTLNLANNKLQTISRGMFRGLHNLEILDLESNQIKQIDWQAFQNMPKLRVLNLGNNSISALELRNLVSLESLHINNNKITSMKRVVLRNLPKLSNLRLDRNQIHEINDEDMSGLRESRQLRSLSLVANNLTRVEANAFKNCGQLTTLSLQNNLINSLQSTPKDGHKPVSWLTPMQKLRRIFLSQNNLSSLENGDLNVVSTLKEVSMDHNQLSTVDKDALKGIQLQKLFLDHNNFHYLPEGIFDGWDTEQIFSVDLSENPWECICNHEWIGEWLNKLGDRSIPSGNIGCVVYQQQRCADVDEGPKHSAWITVFAGVLSFIALLFLTAIAYLYLQEACARSPLPLRRIPSDMLRLIPSVESLTYPNQIPNDPNKRTTEAASVKTNGVARSGSVDETGKNEKKRVRFNELA